MKTLAKLTEYSERKLMVHVNIDSLIIAWQVLSYDAFKLFLLLNGEREVDEDILEYFDDFDASFKELMEYLDFIEGRKEIITQ